MSETDRDRQTDRQRKRGWEEGDRGKVEVPRELTLWMKSISMYQASARQPEAR